jgi:flagellar hook-basal body protein
MDVIANNIANVNTTGFKSQRATFADAFYQNIQGASGPDVNTGRAGTNPRQIGLGLNLASIDNIMTQGAAQRTDNALDAMIEGHGFFIVRDVGGANFFTRAGRIERDSHWNLHIGGMQLMGWSTTPCAQTPGGHRIDTGRLTPLQLSGEKLNMPSEPTTLINLQGNLRTTQLSEMSELGGHTIRPMVIYDSLGNQYTINMRLTFHRQFSEAADSPHSYWTMQFEGTTWIDPATNEAFDPTNDAHTDADGVRLARFSHQAVHAYLEGDRRNPALVAICLLGGPLGGGTPGDALDASHSIVTMAFNTNGDLVGIGEAGPNGEPLQMFPGLENDTWFSGNESGRGRFDMTIVPVTGVAPAATFGDTNRAPSFYGPPPAGTTTHTMQGTLTFDACVGSTRWRKHHHASPCHERWWSR